MEALNISRESVYRRIRGDISFTLEEIAKLSVELGFSIDELIIKDMHSRVFFDLHISGTQDPSETFMIIFQQYFQNTFDMSYAKEIESTMILNHIPPAYVIFFNHLFKFTYYRWMHQNQESSLKYCYSDVTLPDKLVYLQQKAMENMKKIRNNTFIFDPNIFLNLIREIQYYYKRRLITDSEFFVLKEELLALIDMVESIAQTGFHGSEARFNLYLSALNIESSSQYIRCDDQVKSQFFVNSLEPVTITNPSLCAIHKKWLDSIRKYATLITQSNEILQVRYFSKQRSHIEEISELSPFITL
ncbi:MAG: helix-turn-helix domain-containing protein [Candidatus Azobacteroides sp.]|nr:helix-turn-helix domain-containing protein [Candidatus Azobacteroides sp.]